MNLHRLICFSVLAAMPLSGIASAQTNPECIYPQWQWGQTGSVFHYYSQYVFMPNGIQDCNLSYWDNYDSGSGTLDISGGCVSGSNKCDPPGIENVLLSEDRKKSAESGPKTRFKPDPKEFGSKVLNDKGYKNGLLKPNVKLKLTPKPGFKAKEGKPIFVEIVDKNGSSLYIKLFRTMLTDKDGNTLEALTGVQIEKPSKVQMKFDLNTSPGVWEKIADKCFILHLGRKEYVTRLAE